MNDNVLYFFMPSSEVLILTHNLVVHASLILKLIAACV